MLEIIDLSKNAVELDPASCVALPWEDCLSIPSHSIEGPEPRADIPPPEDVLEAARALVQGGNRLWYLGRPARSGEILVAARGYLGWTPAMEAWVFFYDDDPAAMWAHPCRYGVVLQYGRVNGKSCVGITDCDMPPSGRGPWMLDETL